MPLIPSIDEFTAYRWAKGHAVCPVCQQEDDTHPPLALSLCRPPSGPALTCPVHGLMFKVEAA